MPKIRVGPVNKRQSGKAAIGNADMAKIIASAEAATSVPQLRQVVRDLAVLLARLSEAVGLEPKV